MHADQAASSSSARAGSAARRRSRSARRGARRIGIVDDDRVDASNLHRQVLFADADVGELKVVAVARALGAPLPRARRRRPTRSASTSRTRAELVAAYDVVIDGSDNFATKFLANDAAVLARRAAGARRRRSGRAASC